MNATLSFLCTSFHSCSPHPTASIQIYDDEYERYYYHNTRLGTVMWAKPQVLGHMDVPEWNPDSDR